MKFPIPHNFQRAASGSVLPDLNTLLGDHFKMQGAVWDTIGALNDNFGVVGFGIIGVFVLSWVVSIVIYRINRYDEIKVNTDPVG